jgi:hypothetical protein
MMLHAGSSGPASPPDPLAGLAAWWRLLDNGNDFSGHFLDLQDMAAAVTFDGTGAVFPGSGSDLRTVEIVGLADTGLSLAVWFKPDDTSFDLADLLADYVASFPFPQRILRLYWQFSAGRFVYTRAGNSLLAVQAITTDWQHVVLTQAADGVTALYYNGGLVTSGSVPYGTNPAGSYTQLGGEYAGMMRHVGMWSRVITPAEVSLLWGGGTPFDPTA